MTKLAANCGCGWRSVPFHAHQSKLNTVAQAQEHADRTGHKCEVHGIVTPRAQAIHRTGTKPHHSVIERYGLSRSKN